MPRQTLLSKISRTEKSLVRVGKNPVESFVEKYVGRGGFSQLAKESDTSYQSVHKTVLGLYKSIPPKIASHMARILSEESTLTHDGIKSNTYISPYEAERQLQKEYTEWTNQGVKDLIEDIRCGRIEAEALFVPAHKLSEHYPTFKAWRQSMSYSQIDFCKTFLLHQAIINKYENGEMKDLPVSLVDRIEQLLQALFDYPEAVKGGYVQASDSIKAYTYALKKLPVIEQKAS